jgi:Uma2 family endonuclease
MTLAEPITRRWTKTEYMRLAEEGWFEGQRVQLIRGEIVQMPAQGYRHTKAVMRVFEFLREAFGAKHWVRTQFQVDLSEDSQPEPDVSVAEHELEWYKDHPTTALLVVEVSDTSLRLDRRKAGLYSSAGIPEYWILNLGKRSLEVYRGPVADPKEEFGHRYSDVRELSEAEMVAPLARLDARIQVKKFFE